MLLAKPTKISSTYYAFQSSYILTARFLYHAVGVVGFEQTTYTFEEDAGTVEVCAAFLHPSDPSQIAPNVFIDLCAFLSNVTVDGKSSLMHAVFQVK